jgi:hypothetical protein
VKSSWIHQKQATTDEKNRLGEHEAEDEKQKLNDDETVKQQALRKHPKDSEQK